MRSVLNPSVLWRVLLPLVVAPLLGLAARSHAATEALERARLALAAEEVEAAARLAEAAELLPRQPELWEAAGMQALAAEEYASAVRYFQHAAERDSLTAKGLVALGQAYQALGESEAAIGAWEQALEVEQNSAKTLELLAEAQRQEGNFAAAIEQLEALAILEPGRARWRYELGLLLAVVQPEAAAVQLAQASDLDESLETEAESLRLAIGEALNADNPAHAAALIGQALASLEEWDLAGASFEQATRLDPAYAEAWAYLGEARQQKGEEGLAELEKAIELNPDSLAANLFVSLYWRRQGNLDAALVYLEKAVQLEPQNPALQVELGATLAARGDLAAALERYQRATELAPRQARYWTLLAEFTVNNEAYVEPVGLPAARQAVVLAEDDPGALVAMGRVFFLLEDAFSAQRFYERALETEPLYAPSYLHLGLLALSQGEEAKAEEELRWAVELAADSPEGQQAQRLLEQYFP